MSASSAPSPWSPNIPGFQLSWDSTSLGKLKECPRKYALQIIHQWSPKSKGVHLIFGGLYASGVERYAHARATGATHDEATLRVVRWVLENAGERTADGSWLPWLSGDPYKNTYTLLRSLVWNFEDRLTSPFTTAILANGKPAVELSFNFEAFEIGGEVVSLSGHMDEIVEADSQRWVKDDKTTKSALGAYYFQSWSPNNQMSLYSIAGKIILGSPVRGVLVRAAQIGVGFTRFATAQIPRSPGVLNEWMADTQRWIALAREYALTDHWPANDTACGNYGGCPFQKVCSVSPSHRDAWLREDFEKREWNPLQVRGDI